MIYSMLWEKAEASLRRGEVDTNPYLLDRENDLRRGLTLIIRPAPHIVQGMMDVIEQLREVAPEQYFYQPENLHITVLSPVIVSDIFRRETAPIAEYHALFQDFFGKIAPFSITFKGVTASPSTVMMCGYSDELNTVRDHLRAFLAQNGMLADADVRYRLVTAHSSVMRFPRQPEQPLKLLDRLISLRDTEIGTMTVEAVDFVVNDWFMSDVDLLYRYPLVFPA